MFAESSGPTRLIEPESKIWVPHDYQKRAEKFLTDNQAAALFLDPGLGKTSITLSAFDKLRSLGIAKKMLVIAPLRVCQLVWEQEGQEWDQFKHLKFALLHGSKKNQLLRSDADIFLINPEGVAWLTKKYFKKKTKVQRWIFDTVTIDELTRFKNAQSVRHKALMPFMAGTTRRWGLTGTPIPNGYLDLFGQMKVLDGGLSLGQWFTRFRDKYFEADYSGFKYLLRRGGSKNIEAAIKPYVLRMAANDYLTLPPRIDDIRSVVMPKEARKIYEEMKKEMVAQLEEGTIEAGNSAAVYSKLKQMANGAVYAGDGVFEPKKVIYIHDAKIEALAELVEELAGTPLLVGYEFKHDLARLQEVFPDAPYIGSGVTGDQVKQIEKDWNANKLPILFAHPASAGHGLNFQKGNAFHIAWFSATWDYELYDQFIKRVLRQGNKATTVFNHIFIVEDTIDNKTREAILQKGFTQDAFCDALNAEIYHSGKTATQPKMGNEEDADMAVKKLSRRSTRPPVEEEEYQEPANAPAEEDEQEEAPRRTSARTSTRSTNAKLRGAAAQDEDDDNEDEQAPTRQSARSRFSKAVRDEIDDEEEEAPAEKAEEHDEEPPRRAPRRSTTRRSPEPGVEEDEDEPAPAPRKARAKRAEPDTEEAVEPTPALGDDSDDKYAVVMAEILKRAEDLAQDATANDLATLTAVIREMKFNLGH